MFKLFPVLDLVSVGIALCQQDFAHYIASPLTITHTYKPLACTPNMEQKLLLTARLSNASTFAQMYTIKESKLMQLQQAFPKTEYSLHEVKKQIVTARSGSRKQILLDRQKKREL